MNNDELLLKNASRRAGFKIHLAISILVNLLLWIFWLFFLKGRSNETAFALFQGILFISLVWFIVIVAHYLFVYKWNKTLVEKELMKLKQEIKNHEEKIERLKKEKGKNNQEIKF